MADGLKDILSHLNSNTSQETLLRYLNGRLSREEQHEVEKSLLHDDFANDAVEGLSAMSDQAKLDLIIYSLNRDLKNRVARKNARRKKLRVEPQWWLYFSIVIFLLLIVLVYIFFVKHAGS